jgi:hypothetical protein
LITNHHSTLEGVSSAPGGGCSARKLAGAKVLSWLMRIYFIILITPLYYGLREFQQVLQRMEPNKMRGNK